MGRWTDRLPGGWTVACLPALWVDQSPERDKGPPYALLEGTSAGFLLGALYLSLCVSSGIPDQAWPGVQERELDPALTHSLDLIRAESSPSAVLLEMYIDPFIPVFIFIFFF